MHHGRLRWIVDDLAKEGITISLETARKWAAGENKPRQQRNAMLAKILGVDATWLYFGIDPALGPQERKARDQEVQGIISVVAGFIEMDGGHPAFANEADRKSDEFVDIYAVIRGARYSFHVALANEDGFDIPANYQDYFILGVVRREGFAVDIYELPHEAIATHPISRRALKIAVPLSILDNLQQVKSFNERL